MAAYHQPYQSLLDEPISPAAVEGAFASIPFHPHTSIRNRYFNEKKQRHEILHEANELHPHHQRLAEAVSTNLGDGLSKDEVEKRSKELSIKKAEVLKSRKQQIEMIRDPENDDTKIAIKVEKTVLEYIDGIPMDISFVRLQSIYEDIHLEISPEEILSYRYKSLNELVTAAQSLSDTTLSFSGSADQSKQLRSDIRDVLYQLWHFVDYGNTLMSVKIKEACMSLTFCLGHLEINCNKQVNVEQMRCDAEARQEINSVVSSLDKQIAVCRYQLDALEIETNDPNLLGMWQDAINLCNSNFQQLGLTATPFNFPG
ncbi:hypothetical protein B566_EDAN002409 [Ephemera danica]|nr:hypothetical protein B566_EDAN002409 [Ephemera danica]